MKNTVNVQNDLNNKFGHYLDDGLKDEWQLLQEKYPIGTIVTGKVVLIYEFGCFLNVGAKFPAFIPIINLEKSRNILMHGGMLAKEDVERIGINIRDWIRQTG